MTTQQYAQEIRKEIAMQNVPADLRRFVYLRCCALCGFGA